MTEGRKSFSGAADEVKLMTLDPGHFHAALVQKFSLDQLSDSVFIYAPPGPEVQQHLERVESYNSREENPTRWNHQLAIGEDYLERFRSEKPGNVVILSGDNSKKLDYIVQSLDAGVNVLADKPMIIEKNQFQSLKSAFEIANRKNLLLYDIMTERFEITTVLQKELAWSEDVFGTLETGSPDRPAVIKESVHHFFKKVSGKDLIRPAWFYNTSKQGEGIADVNTHLVDLVLWESFPDQSITSDEVEIHNARRWPTQLSREMFSRTTGLMDFPEDLRKFINSDSLLEVYSNGEINFSIRGVHAKTKVTWNFQAPEGSGDTHYSIMRGTKADIEIIQNAEVGFVPTVYVIPHTTDAEYESALTSAVTKLNEQYPGVGFEKDERGFRITIPDNLRKGHEAHFAQVTDKYLQYLVDGKLPDWEVPNMLTRYYITTKALELARNGE